MDLGSCRYSEPGSLVKACVGGQLECISSNRKLALFRELAAGRYMAIGEAASISTA